MSKALQELLTGVDGSVVGDINQTICGLSYNSNEVSDGFIFFCIVGQNVDGHDFAQQALDNGASAIVAERSLALSGDENATFIVVDDARKAMARIACNFYDNPSKSFKLVGITGTNGKTTSTYLIEKFAKCARYKTGVIGTCGIRVGDESIESTHTTPESVDLQRIMAQMRDAGCQIVAMEVSSHALELKRVYGCDFDVTAFTNLTQDHLDYHGTLDDYFAAKSLLFEDVYPAKRVICTDEQWGLTLSARCIRSGQDVVTFGFNQTNTIYPIAVDYDINETKLEMSVYGNVHKLTSPLVGKFNVENLMCAIGVSFSLGISVDDIKKALAKGMRVPGRLERIHPDIVQMFDIFEYPSVYVDYAHTPDALEKAIGVLANLGSGKTIVVFGCGGDRDASKRPLMGHASLLADVAVVTSDNPRSEDPASIISDILPGLAGAVEGQDYYIEEDRARAIDLAINLARPCDIVLIAGKGHEDYQIIGSEKNHFDDREYAKSVLSKIVHKQASSVKSEDKQVPSSNIPIVVGDEIHMNADTEDVELDDILNSLKGNLQSVTISLGDN